MFALSSGKGGHMLQGNDQNLQGPRMSTVAARDALTALKPLMECRLCGKQNAMDATHCRGCGNEFAEVTLSATSKGQRIQNFSAWQQVSVRPLTAVDPETQRARWLYWLGGVAVSLSCIAVLAFLFFQLPA